MMRRSVAVAALLVLVVLGRPAVVRADHCGADATVDPAAGPAGGVFVFETNLGAPSILELRHDGRLVRRVDLASSGPVRYAIDTTADGAGTWTVSAYVQGRPDCRAEASFTALGPPDTSTAPGTLPRALPALVVLGGLATLGLGLGMRVRRS